MSPPPCAILWGGDNCQHPACAILLGGVTIVTPPLCNTLRGAILWWGLQLLAPRLCNTFGGAPRVGPPVC